MDIRNFFGGDDVAKPEAKVSPSKKRSIPSPKSPTPPTAMKKKRVSIPSSAVVILDESDSEVKENVPQAKVLEVNGEMMEMESKPKTDMQQETSSPSSPIRAPKGYSGCLTNKSFAFTGVLSAMDREQAMDLVKSCGGTVAKTIAKKTNYLVIGDRLESGDRVETSAKYKDALEKSVHIINQVDFFNLISSRSMDCEMKATIEEKNKSKGKQVLKNVLINNSLTWTDKHKPTNMSQIIGNGGIVGKLKSWLLNWNNIHVKGTKKVAFNPSLKDNHGARIALLSGPPGIGKSTLATLVALDCGMEVTEYNASDTRSKKSLQSGLSDVTGNQVICFNGGSNPKLKKRVIIMDEVDGMSSGDRGGMAELISIIKKSKTPIICICNDRQSQKVRSLANISYDLRVSRPNVQQIVNRLVQIGTIEGLKIEPNALREAMEKFGNDIRQGLNFMQMWARKSNTMTYLDVKKHFYQMEKDDVLRLNPFSATQQIFSEKSSYFQRTEAYFVDYDLMPLMVQENYMQSVLSSKGDTGTKLAKAMEASELISDSDLYGNYVRRYQRWDLLTNQAAANVAACVITSGFVGRPDFSKWMGRNSSSNKSKRLLSELSIHMRAHASGSAQAIRMDYIPYMKEIILAKLVHGGESEIENVIKVLDACEIGKEDLSESFEHFKLPGIERFSYDQLDSKLKASFTRRYNKMSHKAQALVEDSLKKITTKGMKGKTSKLSDVDEEERSNEDELSDEEQDEFDEDNVEAFKITNKRKTASSSSTSSSAVATSNGKGKKKRK